MSLEQLQEYRKEAAQRLFDNGHVERYTNEYYIVKSETTPNGLYVVEVVHGKHFVCTCLDYEKNSKYMECKHIYAVMLQRQHDQKRSK